jgi:hypothetical protein
MLDDSELQAAATAEYAGPRASEPPAGPPHRGESRVRRGRDRAAFLITLVGMLLLLAGAVMMLYGINVRLRRA